jgi:hypothetical protein
MDSSCRGKSTLPCCANQQADSTSREDCRPVQLTLSDGLKLTVCHSPVSSNSLRSTHPVSPVSDISENRSKSAPVRVICDHAWTQGPRAAVSDAVDQRLAQPGVGNHLGPFRERQVGGDDHGGLLGPFGDDLGEELRANLGPCAATICAQLVPPD